MRRMSCLILGLLMAGTLSVSAGDTKRLRLQSREDFLKAMRLVRTVLTSKGEIRVGFESNLKPVAGEPSVWCAASFRGSLYVGSARGAKFILTRYD